MCAHKSDEVKTENGRERKLFSQPLAEGRKYENDSEDEEQMKVDALEWEMAESQTENQEKEKVIRKE